jgi:hypothetical protein
MDDDRYDQIMLICFVFFFLTHIFFTSSQYFLILHAIRDRSHML